MSKKIYLNKSDDVASAIDKIIKTPDEGVVLYIPRETDAARTKKDIELIKREVEAAGKKLIVESVDEDILSRVTETGIPASNPFLGRSKGTVSDIVKLNARPKRSLRDSGETETKARLAHRVRVSSDGKLSIKPNHRLKIFCKIALGLVIFLGTVAAVLALTPRANITLTLEKIEHDFVGSLRVSPAIEEVSVAEGMVAMRGVLLSQEKNMTKKYPATGTSEVGHKAKGTITIYNAFSTETQPLVATTRFVTPNGKIYRLDQGVTVPGAIGEDGQLTPASITAAITADQPGEEYNSSAKDKLRLPGFQGSPKYDGFYAEIVGEITGGSSGQVKIPTNEDIKLAQSDAAQLLEDAIKAELLLSLPNGIKVLDEASEMEITKQQIDETVDEEGNFALTIYGSVKLIGFVEGELVEAFAEYFGTQDGGELTNYSYSIDYGEIELNLEGEGLLSAAVRLRSTWTKPFDVAAFKQQIVGLKENRLKEVILSTPGVEIGQPRLDPFWVSRVPKNQDRITVDVN